MSPTEIFVFASTAIIVAPTATAALFSTEAPNPSASTKLTSPPTIVVASADKVTVVPEIADTVVPAAIPSPKTASPTAILVASATDKLFASLDASREPVV